MYIKQLQNLVYKTMGDYEKAVEYYNNSLSINLKTLGKNHPNVAVAHNNLGVLYRAKGDNEKALEHHTKSLSIRLKT